MEEALFVVWRRMRWSLLAKIEGDPLNTQHKEEAVFIRDSITEAESISTEQHQGSVVYENPMGMLLSVREVSKCSVCNF